VADNRLIAFIERALQAGRSRDEIAGMLEAAGWSHDRIADGLAYFAESDDSLAVPRPKAQLSARDAFWYLLMFATLYISSYQLGALLFQFINLAFPDELDQFGRAAGSRAIRWAVASLIVAFPIFLLVARRVSRETLEDPTRRTSAVRKWLTYLTLFIAAVVLLGDAITLLSNLLGGELTSRFVLKTIVVALIAGAIFTYYLRAMKADDEALGQ
jgi:hypothetical protein